MRSPLSLYPITGAQTHTCCSGGLHTSCCYSIRRSALLFLFCILFVARRFYAHSLSFSPEIKYVMIGCAIGLFFLVGFIIVKLYIIRKHLHDNSTGEVIDRSAHYNDMLKVRQRDLQEKWASIIQVVQVD
uniref:Uncharacterized protein n=1 Tax=Echeneis naucrates TaxID=173247 RepID=A0A665V811_ECHNA